MLKHSLLKTSMLSSMLRLTELEIIPLLDSPLWLFLPFFKTILLRISPQPLLGDILLIDRCSPCFCFFSSLSSCFFGDDFSKTQGLIFFVLLCFHPFYFSVHLLI